MTTVSFKKAAILSYIAKRKDLSAPQRRVLRAAMSGKLVNASGLSKPSAFGAGLFKSQKPAKARSGS